MNDDIEAVKACPTCEGPATSKRVVNPLGGFKIIYKTAVPNLQTRAEQAEAECLEQARLNGMGSQREARLMAQLASAQAEVARHRAALQACKTLDTDTNSELKAQIATLRAAIAEAARRAGDPELVGDAVGEAIEFVTEPLRNLPQPEQHGTRSDGEACSAAWVKGAPCDCQPEGEGKAPAFRIGDRVEKVRGSNWRGTICGTYSTSITPEGYAVESAMEPGNVQIYPVVALKAWDQPEGEGKDEWWRHALPPEPSLPDDPSLPPLAQPEGEDALIAEVRGALDDTGVCRGTWTDDDARRLVKALASRGLTVRGEGVER